MTPQRSAPQGPRAGAGFTLLEIAVALFVVTLVLGALLVPLSQQVESRKLSETQRTLDLAVEALQGFASANGRLPCPASAASNGVESPVGGGICTNPLDGFLPAVTLGVSPTDANGYLIDAWSSAQALSRVRYAVATTTHVCATPGVGNLVFATVNGMRNCWSQITAAAVEGDLVICSTATGIGANACAAGATLFDKAIAVVYSVGANAGTTSGAGIDEQANPNPVNGSVNRTFVSHLPSGTAAPNGEFDDVMVWISPNVLYSKLIAASQLP
ncbi:MAG: type II secretion system protein [Burkholderiales bacterium]